MEVLIFVEHLPLSPSSRWWMGFSHTLGKNHDLLLNKCVQIERWVNLDWRETIDISLIPSVFQQFCFSGHLPTFPIVQHRLITLHSSPHATLPHKLQFGQTTCVRSGFIYTMMNTVTKIILFWCYLLCHDLHFETKNSSTVPVFKDPTLCQLLGNAVRNFTFNHSEKIKIKLVRSDHTFSSCSWDLYLSCTENQVFMEIS